MNMSGEVDAGYQSISGTVPSSHGLGMGGSASLSGYYFTPQFVSFDVDPYYGRNQSSSLNQTITDQSGLNVFTRFFGATRFPGSATYGRSHDSFGTFGIPGASGLVGDSNQHAWNFNWGVHMPDLPSVDLSYLMGGNDASVFGTDIRTRFGNRSFDLHSGYDLGKYKINGFFTHDTFNGSSPILEQSGEVHHYDFQGGVNIIGVYASHPFPFQGLWSGSWTHSTTNSHYLSSLGTVSQGNGSGKGDGFGSTVSMRFARSFSVGAGIDYQTNSLVALQSQLLQSGVFAPLQSSQSTSKSMNVSATAYYNLKHYATLYGTFNHGEVFPTSGPSRGITLYGGGFTSNYTNHLLGTLTYTLGVTDRANQVGNAGTDFRANASYMRLIHEWKTSADFNYAQRLNTLNDVYVTSSYGFGGTLQRKFGNYLYWNSAARFGHSGIQQFEGNSFRHTTLSTSASYRKYGAGFTYTDSSGASVIGSQGLVAVADGIPTQLLGSPILFGATSYSIGGSFNVRRYTFTVNNTQATSHTTALALAQNRTSNWNAELRVRMRKLYLNIAYRRIDQVVGPPGTPKNVVNSFGVTLSRWFNVF